MDYSGFSVCGILQVGILEWVPFSRGSSQTRDRTKPPRFPIGGLEPHRCKLLWVTCVAKVSSQFGKGAEFQVKMLQGERKPQGLV